MDENKRNSPTGYRKICDEMLNQINKGFWAPGDRLPSEAELMSRFGVSKMTADRARQELSRLGVIDAVPGVGTFVSVRARSSAQQLSRRLK